MTHSQPPQGRPDSPINAGVELMSARATEDPLKVRCGDCRYFVRDGRCGFLQSDEGRKSDRPFAHAPFWVWSDCYSDKEQVRFNVRTLCPTYEATPDATGARAEMEGE